MTGLSRIGCRSPKLKRFRIIRMKKTTVIEIGAASWVEKLNISINIGRKTIPPPTPATVQIIVAEKKTKVAPISEEAMLGKRFLWTQEPEEQIWSMSQVASVKHFALSWRMRIPHKISRDLPNFAMPNENNCFFFFWNLTNKTNTLSYCDVGDDFIILQWILKCDELFQTSSFRSKS